MSNKKPYGIALLAIVLLPVVAAAQSPFDGTWKQDLSQPKIHMKPLVYLMQDGMYHCESCPAPFTIKADGQDHKVSGMAWLDTVTVKVWWTTTPSNWFAKRTAGSQIPRNVPFLRMATA